MELRWRTESDSVAPTIDEVNACIAESGVEVVSVVRIEEGLANENYRVETISGESYFFRVYKRERAAQELEAALAASLVRLIPIPAVLYVNRDAAVSLSEWSPGATLQRVFASDRPDRVVAYARELGQILSRIARVRFDSAGFFDSALIVTHRWTSFWDGILGYFDHCARRAVALGRLDERCRAQIESIFARDDKAIREATSEPCLSHGDYKPANILVDGSRVTAILDWEFAHSGSWLLDAGQLLRYLGPVRESFAREFEVGLTDGDVTIPCGWSDLARTIDIVNLVDFLCRPAASQTQILDVLGLLDESLIALT